MFLLLIFILRLCSRSKDSCECEWVCVCAFFFFIFLRTNYQSAILFEGNFFFFTILLLILQVRTNELYTWHCRYIGSGFGFNCFCRCYIHVVCVCESLSVHIFCRLCEAILFEIQKLLLCALLWPPILFRACFFFSVMVRSED